jgi:hypothetical protein
MRGAAMPNGDTALGSADGSDRAMAGGSCLQLGSGGRYADIVSFGLFAASVTSKLIAVS